MEIRYTQRGFQYIYHDPYITDGNEGLIQQSSAIGVEVDSFQKPGSSFLWIKGLFHLDRRGIEEMIGYLVAWLETGSFDQAQITPVKIPSARSQTNNDLQVGDKISVKALCWSGYDHDADPTDEIFAEPGAGLREEGRKVFRVCLDEPIDAVFVGWSYLLVGVRHPGYQDSEDGIMPPYFTEHKRIKIARWIPTGRQYLKPFAVLPEDID